MQNLLTASYGPAGVQFSLDLLGEVSIVSTSAKMVPEKLGQKP